MEEEVLLFLFFIDYYFFFLGYSDIDWQGHFDKLYYDIDLT